MFSKKSHSAEKLAIPYLYTLIRTLGYAYLLPNAIAYLNTCIPYLNTCITYLNTLTRPSTPCIAYLNTLSRLRILIHALPILIHWAGIWLHILKQELPILIHCPIIPYLNTLSRTIPFLNTLSRTHPACAQNRRILGGQSESSTKKPSTSSADQNRVLRHLSRQPIRIECSITRQPIKFEYYVTRVVSQSESSLTSTEISRLGWRSRLGSRLESARYSLS